MTNGGSGDFEPASGDYRRLRPPPDASRGRQLTYQVIFGSHTPWGRTFDVVLILAILASVLAIMLESVADLEAQYGDILRTAEVLFTIAFTLEYALRLWCVGQPRRRYAKSFFGIVDLLAILPTWLAVIIPGGQAFGVIRILRVLRVFRILKLVQYMGEAEVLVPQK